MMQIIKSFRAELVKVAVFILIYVVSLVHVLNSSGTGVEKIIKDISESIKF